MFTRTEQVFSPNFLNIARTSIFETGFTVSFLHSRALFSGLRIRVQWKNDMHDGKILGEGCQSIILVNFS